MAEFSYEDFLRYQTVPRETFFRLQQYIEALKKWQKTINLISTSTLSEVWLRHVIDSAQLKNHIADEDSCADIGSGAGFPGMVLAILGVKQITLIESDARKSAFLREAARVSETSLQVLNQRAEAVSLSDFSTIITRGFASLENTLTAFSLTLNVNHNLLLLKGKEHKKEIEEAEKHWSFDYKTFPSISDTSGVILRVRNIKPKE